MNPTAKNFQYIESLGGKFNRTILKHDVDVDGCRLYLYKRQEYIKRNGKTCYVDLEGVWIPFDKSLIRYSSSVEHNPNSPVHEDYATYRRRTCKYLKSEDIKTIIENYGNINNIPS